MKRFKKVLVVALMLAFASSFLLVGSVQSALATENPVTLDWWFQEWAGGVAWQRDYIAKFEAKYPNINVNLVVFPYSEIAVKMIPSIAFGNEPQMMYGYDASVIPKGADPGKLFLPISPDPYTIDEWKNDIAFPLALERMIGSDGQLYGYPFIHGADAYGFLYHKDIFRDVGVSPEGINSWDDFKALAKKLTVYNADGTIQRSGVLFSYTEVAKSFLDMIFSQGAREDLTDFENAEWNFELPEARKALEMIKSFVDEKIYDPESGHPSTAFPNKTGAMLLQGLWGLGAVLTTYPELEVGYINMPPFIEGDPVSLGSATGQATMLFSKRLAGDEKEAAFTWLTELIENPAEYFDIPLYHEPPYWMGCIDNRKYLDILENRPADEMNEFSRAALSASAGSFPTFAPIGTRIASSILINDMLFPQLEKVFQGEQTVDEALAYLTEFVTSREKVLAEQ